MKPNLATMTAAFIGTELAPSDDQLNTCYRAHKQALESVIKANAIRGFVAPQLLETYRDLFFYSDTGNHLTFNQNRRDLMQNAVNILGHFEKPPFKPNNGMTTANLERLAASGFALVMLLNG
ncbi:hypothetical protein [Thiosulfatimonas sediminis]|nr:hypothetical protein [Thiosulfatimonas sediminis]